MIYSVGLLVPKFSINFTNWWARWVKHEAGNVVGDFTHVKPGSIHSW